ncbi:mitochondrial ribosomal protein L19 [Brevipalpus obovatus]|uniref:mitochondrial ribosomal protein L19 n=1 Tax=Brevipalpus obovatus TaxID=246614 RepID=UPI003D9E8A8A
MGSNANISKLLMKVLPRSSRSIHTGCMQFKAKYFDYFEPSKKNIRGSEFPVGHTTRLDVKRGQSFKDPAIPEDLAELRNVYPEFLPNSDPLKRNRSFCRMERQDMLARRVILDIPEFHPGSILAVTVSDPNAVGKVSRFVGICILRENVGLRASFTLRNIVDREGIEITYDLYNPTIRSIEVLKLERRLDDDLRYLRDALPEYSTVPLDMAPEIRREGEPVPLNPLKVTMGPFPWTKKWWHHQYRFATKGIDKIEGVHHWYYERSLRNMNVNEKYDLMKEYRQHIPEEEQLPIWKEVSKHDQEIARDRKQKRRARLISR